MKYCIQLNGDTCKEPDPAPYLVFDREEVHTLKNKYRQLHKIPAEAKIIIIHPGTGGSAINLSLQQYADVAKTISKNIASFFVITAGPGELEIAQRLSELIPELSHCMHQSNEGIIEFCKFINICDLFISGSTGPLHIAGALNINTAAFYPSRRSATSLRWQTLNDDKHRVSFTASQDDMSAIDPQQSSADIIHLLSDRSSNWFKSYNISISIKQQRYTMLSSTSVKTPHYESTVFKC